MTFELPIFPFREICDFVIVDYSYYFPLLDLDKTTTISTSVLRPQAIIHTSTDLPLSIHPLPPRDS